MTAKNFYKCILTSVISTVNAAGNESNKSTILTVTTQAASNPVAANLSWVAPTKNTDDSCIAGIDGYRLSYGMTSGSYSVIEELTLNTGGISCTQTDYDMSCNAPILTCHYTTQPLSSGTWYFVIQALDNSSRLSSYSNEATKQVN